MCSLKLMIYLLYVPFLNEKKCFERFSHMWWSRINKIFVYFRAVFDIFLNNWLHSLVQFCKFIRWNNENDVNAVTVIHVSFISEIWGVEGDNFAPLAAKMQNNSAPLTRTASQSGDLIFDWGRALKMATKTRLLVPYRNYFTNLLCLQATRLDFYTFLTRFTMAFLCNHCCAYLRCYFQRTVSVKSQVFIFHII